MNLENAEYRIIYRNNFYYLLVDDVVLKTPGEKDVKHTNRKILENIQYELECVDELNVTDLSTYDLISTQLDIVESSDFYISKETFRNVLLNDPTLKACAGPERIEQFAKWGALFEHLILLDIYYPDIIQSFMLDDIERWIQSMGKDYADSIDKLVDHFYREFEILSNPQKTAVINSTNLHGAVIYGLLLATKKCNDMEYAVANLASHCIIPNVFPDVIRSEYRESLLEIKQHAFLISNFVNLSLTPGIKLSQLIKLNVPNWGLLPEGSRDSITESMRNIYLAQSDDYSSYVMLLGKSVEIALKQLVFDEFQYRGGIEIHEKKEQTIFLKENEKIRPLANFVVKEPHFIELGSMLVVLEKFGGKTSLQNHLLQAFFDFIKTQLNYSIITDKGWIEKAKDISRVRNRAAHSDRFTLDEAISIQKTTFEVLTAF